MNDQENKVAVSGQGSDLQVISETGMPFKTIISETAKPLSDILMANIQKVQKDPSFISQAKEVRDNVRELVNLARVEIDMIREARKVIKK